MMNKLMTLLFKALNRSFAVMYASLDRAVDAANRMGVKFGKKSEARQYAINRIAGKVGQNDNEA